MFPSIIPTLNQILFNGDRVFEFIKPKIKKIIDKIADQTLKLPPLNNGNIETIKKKIKKTIPKFLFELIFISFILKFKLMMAV